MAVLEHLEKSKEACKVLLSLSQEKNDKNWEKRARYQLMREDCMLGNLNFVSQYEDRFKENETKDNLNLYLTALAMGDMYQSKEALRLGKQYIDQFSEEEKVEIYPNLMDFAYAVKDKEYVEQCFHAIISGTRDKDQIYNAWWLLGRQT